MPAPTEFPAGFLWGAATSAYQVEGSPLADGAGPSNWHRFSHTPGKVRGGDTGDVACDHFRRYPDDVGIMHDLGLTAYRFSLSWSRLLPEGRGLRPRRPPARARESPGGGGRLASPAVRPWGRGPPLSGYGTWPHRPGGEPGAQASGERAARGSSGHRSRRGLHEPPVPGSGPE